MKNITDMISKKDRPVKVLQYGEGNFLRAFVDWMVDILNEKTDFNGSIVMVQPLERGMGDMINAQDGAYTTVLRGYEDGEEKCITRAITSVKECINPYMDYEKYMALAELESLRFVFSNTTEAGICYEEGVKADEKPQKNFPAKVASFLYKRYASFKGDRSKGLVFIPCELIDKNGAMLEKHVLHYAEEWNLGKDFIAWVKESCDFCSSLVDRIVPGYPRAEKEMLEEKLGYTDNLLDAAELFHFWAIEYTKRSYEDELPLKKAGLNVVWTDDMSFYRTRKVRILNGAHTMTVLAAHKAGLDTVKECIDDKDIYAFMQKGLFEEIIPSMDGDKELLVKYAGDVLERFRNPYIVHLLISISLNSVSKFKTRDLPSLKGYQEKTGRLPEALCFSLSSLIAFYEGTEIREGALIGKRGEEEYQIKDSPEVLEIFKNLYSTSYANLKEKAEKIASAVLSKEGWFGEDLRKIPGLEEKIAGNLENIWSLGVREAMKKVL